MERKVEETVNYFQSVDDTVDEAQQNEDLQFRPQQ